MQLRSTYRTISARHAATTGLIAGSLALATMACSDTRLDKMSAGISRDSALAIINEGTSGDSMARVYKQDSFLLENKTGNVHVANVLFYSGKGLKTADDTSVARSTTPVVVIDGKVTGWGWTYYDSLAKANNIPVPAAK